jgi:hypothetical protein
MLGLEFARAVAAPTTTMLAHSLPEKVDVVVRDAETDQMVASGKGLSSEQSRPMARLTVDGAAVRRENVWPGEDDLGKPVVLPGGEVGILRKWWNAEDGSEWRWEVEFSNHV